MPTNQGLDRADRDITIRHLRFQLYGAAERFDRLRRLILLLPCQAKIHPALREVGCNFECALEQSLGITPLFGAHGYARKQSQRVDIGRVSEQHVTIDFFRLAHVAHALQTQSANKRFTVRRQLERFFELVSCIVVPAQACQHLRFLHANGPAAGLEFLRSLQRLECITQASLHDQGLCQAFMSPRETGVDANRSRQRVFGLIRLLQLDQRCAQQAEQICIARVLVERLAADAFSHRRIAGTQECRGPVERGLGGVLFVFLHFIWLYYSRRPES